MKSRRKYVDQFKSDAVNLAMSSEKSMSEVARELGVPGGCLGRWKRDYLNTLDGDASEVGAKRLPSDLEKELRQTRKELAEVTLQREILKKAIGIFSQKPDRYTTS